MVADLIGSILKLDEDIIVRSMSSRAGRFVLRATVGLLDASLPI
jgi:hypothetical protein